MEHIVFVHIEPDWSVKDLLGREHIRIVEPVCKVGRSLTNINAEVCAGTLTHEHVIAEAFAGLFVRAVSGICALNKHIELTERALESEESGYCTKSIPDKEILVLLGSALCLLVESSDIFDLPVA